MLGVVFFCVYLALGYMQSICLFRSRGALTRLWLGAVMGLIEMMWLPTLCSVLFDFTVIANVAAVAVAAALTVACTFAPKDKLASGLEELSDEPPIKLVVLLLIPITALVAYLQYTHTLREVDGALHVGQSTFGDLCMHMSFATGLIGQSFPAEYSILPGTLLGYPYLVDALSASMMIFGTSLRLAFIIPSVVMTVLIYMGFMIFSWEISKKRSTLILALVFFLFNGGLGFIRVFDTIGVDTTALTNALYGRYQAPTNMENYSLNLRWVNALCDMLIPQRSLMAGWLCVLPAFYLLVTGMRTKKLGTFTALGVWAGTLPMIHTHSFLALALVSAGALAYCFFSDKTDRRKTLINFGVYALIACVMALPQLFTWSFPQTLDGGYPKFLFNWVNNNEHGGLKDGYIWFWIKNVGIIFPFLFIAALSNTEKRVKALSLGCLILFIVAELVVFQPNVYDNGKLFFIAFILTLPACCELLVSIYNRLHGIRGRAALACGFILISTLSGALTIVRECISDEYLFSKSEVAASEYIKNNTPKDSMFLTDDNHNNVVATLTGRKIVCGSGSYLYFHGLKFEEQIKDASCMLKDPLSYQYLYRKYDVDYVYVSSYEDADRIVLDEMFPCVYSGGEWYDIIKIYAVSERAQLGASNISTYTE